RSRGHGARGRSGSHAGGEHPVLPEQQSGWAFLGRRSSPRFELFGSTSIVSRRHEIATARQMLGNCLAIAWRHVINSRRSPSRTRWPAACSPQRLTAQGDFGVLMTIVSERRISMMTIDIVGPRGGHGACTRQLKVAGPAVPI